MKNLCFVFLLFLLSSCDLGRSPKIHDPSQNLTREDFKSLNKVPDFFEEEDLFEQELEDEQKIIRSGLIVSLNLQGKIAVADIAKELAKQLNCGFLIQKDQILDINYKVEKQPIEDVFDDLQELTGVIFSFGKGIIAARSDGFYFKSYPLNYLALNREGNSDVSVNTQSTEKTQQQ